MDKTVTPYELPDRDNHSFFFVDAHIPPQVEARLHRHAAWELLYVMQGHGSRTAGDSIHPFKAGDVALIPPDMVHEWHFDQNSTDAHGLVRYLMVAFSADFVENFRKTFPEARNRLAENILHENALHFGMKSAASLQQGLKRMLGMQDFERLCELLQLLPKIFIATDHSIVGRPVSADRNIQRIQQVCTYVMRHYASAISLDEIAHEARMNKSAFCTWFKRCKSMTFSQFLKQYRMNTAKELLKATDKNISEICYLVGFNDLPHFVRAFKSITGLTPSDFRKMNCRR